MEPKRFTILIKRDDGIELAIPVFEAMSQEDAEEAVKRDHPGCEILKCEPKED